VISSSWFSGIGLEPVPPQIDGKVHRLSRQGRSDKSCWYIAWSAPMCYILAGDWRTGERWSWSDKTEMSAKEKRDFQKKLDQAMADRRAEREQQYANAALKADIVLRSAKPAGESEYLRRKNIQAFGLKFDGDDLLMPMADLDGHLWGYQRISPCGRKMFLSGQRAKGTCHVIGDLLHDVIIICEGYATGASIHMATGQTVVCALFAGNLAAITAAVRLKHPKAHVVIAADNDQWTDGNPGLTEATRIAKGLFLYLAVPVFRDTSS